MLAASVTVPVTLDHMGDGDDPGPGAKQSVEGFHVQGPVIGDGDELQHDPLTLAQKMPG